MMEYGDLYKQWCEWSPEHVDMVTNYRPWGENQILVWLKNGQVYKVTYHEQNKFTMELFPDWQRHMPVYENSGMCSGYDNGRCTVKQKQCDGCADEINVAF